LQLANLPGENYDLITPINKVVNASNKLQVASCYFKKNIIDP